jgi:hypothetical protein
MPSIHLDHLKFFEDRGPISLAGIHAFQPGGRESGPNTGNFGAKYSTIQRN